MLCSLLKEAINARLDAPATAERHETAGRLTFQVISHRLISVRIPQIGRRILLRTPDRAVYLALALSLLLPVASAARRRTYYRSYTPHTYRARHQRSFSGHSRRFHSYHRERRTEARNYSERRLRSRRATRRWLSWLRYASFGRLGRRREKRSEAAKDAFKRQNPCPSNGWRSGPCPGYVIDHIRPLACGGADAPSNMQWQTVRAGKAKDKWERKGCM